MPEYTLYDDSSNPTNPNENDGEPERILGTIVKNTVDTYIIGMRWRTPTGGLPPTVYGSLWSLTSDDPTSNTGTRLEIVQFDFTGVTAGQWARLNFAAPIFWTNNTPRAVQVYISGGRYTFSNPNTFASPHSAPFTNNTLTVYDDHSNGRWTNNPAGTFPAGDNQLAANNYPGGSGYNFWVDIIVNDNPTTHPKGSEFVPFF